MRKRALLVGFILLLLVAIPVTVFLVLRQQELRSRAAPATTLSFDPTTKTVRPNDTFSLNVVMNTGVNSVATAEVYLTFDPAKLTATEFKAGTFMPHALVEPTLDNTNGRAFIAVDTLSADASPGTVPFTKQGTGTVAVITFKAKTETGATPTTVGFSQETKAFGETGGTLEPTNLIVEDSYTKTAKITISAVAASPTPTPTLPAGTPTPTPFVQNKPPVCNSLSTSPASGNAPLTATLTANASDQDNDVVSALFTFGDGQTQTVDKNIGQLGSFQVSHVYQTAGTITAQAIVRDSNAAVSATCTTTISIAAAGGEVPTAVPTTPPPPAPTIPQTADITPTTILSIAGAALVVIGTILFFAL